MYIVLLIMQLTFHTYIVHVSASFHDDLDNPSSTFHRGRYKVSTGYSPSYYKTASLFLNIDLYDETVYSCFVSLQP